MIKPHIKKIFMIGTAVSTGLLLSACGGGGSGSEGTGTLNLSMTDAPVNDASNVYVSFSSVELKGEGGTRLIEFETPMQMDLLALQGSESTPLLDDLEVSAGAYQWIRLGIETEGDLDTYMVIDSAIHELTVPSGSESGLKLNRGFDMPVNGSANFTIDFDLQKSIHENNSGYVMRPTLRIVDNSEIGHIQGSIDATWLSTNCGDETQNSVYAYEGSDVTADDLGSATEPVTASLVAYDEESTTYSFELGFLLAGDYTIAFTCQADSDDPLTDDDIAFVAQTNVSVTADQTTNHNFE